MVYDIGVLLSQWEAIGVFDFLLPFLLIFAVVFGILTATNILNANRAINLVIALVVGLMALRFDFVPRFFAEIFPRLGIGLAVILTVLIAVGLFIPDQERRYWYYGLGAIGAIVAIVVVSKTFASYGWFSGWGGFSDNGVNMIILAVGTIGVIVALAIGSTAGRQQNQNATATFGPHRAP